MICPQDSVEFFQSLVLKMGSLVADYIFWKTKSCVPID